MAHSPKKAWLVLETGEVYPGTAFGAPGESAGELIFNTGMSGYVEVLSDPSYTGQVVVMTNPHIGNYGVQDGDSGALRTSSEVLDRRDRHRAELEPPSRPDEI